MTTSSSKKRLRAVTWFLAAVLLCLCDWSLFPSFRSVALFIQADSEQRLDTLLAFLQTRMRVLRQPSTQYRIVLFLAALLALMLVWYLLCPIPTSLGMGMSSREGILL